MINKAYKAMLSNKSKIREFSEFATRRGKEIGYENVFDYSLGNPSVAVPAAFKQEMLRLMDTESDMALHGYSPTLGNELARERIAAHLSARFGIPYEKKHIFMTSGAAGAIAHAVRCVTEPGDEVITFAPYFTEYNPYVNGSGAVLKVVDPDYEGFQINFDRFEALINEKTAAVLINTPNNPTGIMYSAETLTALADLLKAKQAKYGHEIFIISDEPYREIVFDGKTSPCVSAFYDNTIMCYSFSKSLSLPGERIGYVAVNPKAADADYLVPMCGQISRGTGHNCPASSIQQAVSAILDTTSDLSVYETNMNLIYDRLVELGLDVIRPDGTFYIFPKAPEADSMSFCQKAMKYELILVPGDAFAAPSYFRMAYCIDTEKVERSLDVISKFIKTEYR